MVALRSLHLLCARTKTFRHSNCFKLFRCNFRGVFSVSGTWEHELGNKMKKDVEDYWRDKINVVEDNEDLKSKYYLLSMFPYPSGHLHMGHVRIYTVSDAFARFYRMRGKKVIFPIGWDAFGLPAENAAIEKKIHPAKWTASNIDAMRKQLKMLNISFDWERELSTCDPSYYKWTQYLFLLMYEKGLVYKKKSLVNWDPVDQTVLADEQVDENGCSWRSGCKVEKRGMEQWFLRTTAYSKDLHEGLRHPELYNWRDITKIQKEWIGECTGYTLHMKLVHQGSELSNTLPVWTDKPELLYGASFVVISPENHFNSSDWGGGRNTGDCRLDIEAIHPLTGSLLPVFVSTTLATIPATDSFIGVPGSYEDEVCLNFAVVHDLDVIPVFNKSTKVLMNSEEFSGLNMDEAKVGIVEKIRKSGVEVCQSSSNLRDWLISRQRYWGTPIPIINCPTCKVVPVQVSELPVVLPNLEEFTGKGSTLSSATEWLSIKCPRCGGAATRETDTMDTFVDSSWYFLRYLDVGNPIEPFSAEKISHFMPVDLYVGGKEHALLHLFYARFMAHFCHSLGVLQNPEPFRQLLMQGMIHGQSYRIQESGKYIPKEEVDFSGKEPVEKSTGESLIVEWEKMSKSKLNGVDPEEVLKEHGIDATRLFILCGAAPQFQRNWSDDLFHGIWKWQRRIWLTVSEYRQQKTGERDAKKLSEDDMQKHEKFLFESKNLYIKGTTHNFLTTRQLSVAITKLQGLTGDLRNVPKGVVKHSTVYEDALATLLIMLAPLAPHFSSELWHAFCSVATSEKYRTNNKPVFHQKWPEVDDDYEMSLNIKVNGTRFDTILLPKKKLDTLDEESAVALAFTSKKLQGHLENIKIKVSNYTRWPEYDGYVNIIYTSMKKNSAKKMKNKSI